MKTCPNCGFQTEPTDTECPKCGIIYEKYEAIGARKKALESERKKQAEAVRKRVYAVIINKGRRVCSKCEKKMGLFERNYAKDLPMKNKQDGSYLCGNCLPIRIVCQNCDKEYEFGKKSSGCPHCLALKLEQIELLRKKRANQLELFSKLSEKRKMQKTARWDQLAWASDWRGIQGIYFYGKQKGGSGRPNEKLRIYVAPELGVVKLVPATISSDGMPFYIEKDNLRNLFVDIIKDKYGKFKGPFVSVNLKQQQEHDINAILMAVAANFSDLKRRCGTLGRILDILVDEKTVYGFTLVKATNQSILAGTTVSLRFGENDLEISGSCLEHYNLIPTKQAIAKSSFKIAASKMRKIEIAEVLTTDPKGIDLGGAAGGAVVGGFLLGVPGMLAGAAMGAGDPEPGQKIQFIKLYYEDSKGSDCEIVVEFGLSSIIYDISWLFQQLVQLAQKCGITLRRVPFEM